LDEPDGSLDSELPMTSPQVSYLRDCIYGGIDGVVTTFAIVAGVVAADLSPRIVLILGVAHLVSDGFSMAASNFSGTKSEHDEFAWLRASEEGRIERLPGEERDKVRRIYRAKGVAGLDLERVVSVLTADRERWIGTMMSEAYNQPKLLRTPWKAAFATFAAFLVCGAIPLLPFAVQSPSAVEVSLVSTALVFFGIGSIKSRWTTASWWRSGLETLTVGLAAAGLAYIVGHYLKDLV
jgi:VIT1/CCC1 family predicted Fe2+/Mn2+ transporter